MTPKNQSNSRVKMGTRGIFGYSIIEVLFAFLILGTSAAFLFVNQSQSVRMAERGRSIIVASELARKKLIDCKIEMLKDGFGVADYSSEGNFEEDNIQGFTWECKGTRINVVAPNLNALTGSQSGQGGPSDSSMLSVLGPVFSLLAKNLGDSARELSAVVRWDNKNEEVKVSTHVTKPDGLARTLGGIPVPGGPNPRQPSQNPSQRRTP